MKRIAVLVSGSGTNLQALIDAEKSGVIKSGKIELVLSNKEDAYALERAKTNGIKTAVLKKSDFSDRGEYSKALAAFLEKEEIDLVILAGFMVILSPEFFKNFENKVINVHPSLIPSFCGEGFYGLEVHRRALEKGVRVSGATVHFVNEITDGGAIILQKAVEVEYGDTPETLQKRIMEQAEWKILPEAAELFCSGKITVKNGRLIINN